MAGLAKAFLLKQCLMDNTWFNDQVLRSYNASPNKLRAVKGVKAIIAVQISDSLIFASYTRMVYGGHGYR